jgi:hypothetical protein
VRKLQSVIGFDVIERYEKIIEAIEELENPFFDATLEWYKNRLDQLKKRVKESGATKTYKITHEEKPIPKARIIKTTVKKRKVGRPGPMPAEELKTAGKDGKKLTAIQRLILSKSKK